MKWGRTVPFRTEHTVSHTSLGPNCVKRGITRNQFPLDLNLGLKSLQNWEKTNVLFKSLRPWHFVMAAEADQYTALAPDVRVIWEFRPMLYPPHALACHLSKHIPSPFLLHGSSSDFRIPGCLSNWNLHLISTLVDFTSHPMPERMLLLQVKMGDHITLPMKPSLPRWLRLLFS